MNPPIAVALLGAIALLGAEDARPPAPLKPTDPLQLLHQAEAAHWRMYLDGDREVEARFNPTPVYVWTNPTRSGGQQGAVYVWTDRGRPVVVGSIFSHPKNGRRQIYHEFHSLAPSVLAPVRGADDEAWVPKAAVTVQPLDGAATPDKSPSRRLVQMRNLSREFSAHSIDLRKERWELRLLPQPLYRFEKPEGDVIDGALFAFVTSAGTDPEAVLALEARRDTDGPAWYYRALRFSDSNLYVERGGKEVWTSILDPERTQLYWNNTDHTYRLIRDKVIDELRELVKEEP